MSVLTQEGISEEKIGACFRDNLTFFKAHLPKLYAKLLPPPTLYNLLYDVGGINILNLTNGTLLFPCLEGKHQMLAISKDWAEHILNNPKWQLHDNGVSLGPSTLSLTNQACQAIIEVVSTYPCSQEYHLGRNFYPPTAIYGLAGGLFLALLLEQGAFFHALYLFEEHIDLLRISCYFINYRQLFNTTPPNSCVISLEKLNVNLFQHIFTHKKITHSFLHLEFDPYKNKISQEIAHRFNMAKKSALRGWGSFEDEMLGLNNTLENFKHNPSLLHPKRIKRIEMPICVVGNGPSLNNLLPFLKEHAKEMVIFSCGTALKVLKSHGILVDFQVEIERIGYLKEVLLNAPLDNTPLMCANMLNPEALKLAKESYMFMRGGSASGYIYPHLSVEYSAPFVGNAGVALASLFSSTLILCGLDCGYIEGQSKHAKGSYYGVEKPSIPPNTLEVRSNFKDTRVFSDGLFLLSQMQMSALFAKQKTRVYNLSSGAFIKHTIPTHPQDLHFKPYQKSKAIRHIKQAFKKNQSPTLCITPLETFQAKLNTLLQTSITSKKDLYHLIDCISTLSVKSIQEEPLAGILLEGSLSHICLHMLVSSLHLKQSDIPSFYAQAKEILLSTLEKMIGRYRWQVLQHKSKI
ncbi:6-hydroxymethylpterin diphosphokinase MptE-like protein [Helicobacter suis]|uniref:6-hydroxymethylpterin diphosphokinase MptE-like protein n=1 Tax=Helicobacter suis TaxID=104628 RepID=UPI0013D3DF03|nr:6-hydroxymethylpterin diphosphokinase MptE-like protein [Helicobacter suis]